MTFTLAASALLLAGFAVSVAATLAVPNRWVAPRPATLVLAAIVSTAWPLSGYPLPLPPRPSSPSASRWLTTSATRAAAGSVAG